MHFPSTRNAAQFARQTPFRSPYVELCANYIHQRQDSYTDQFLEKVVRVQMFIDKIGDIFSTGKAPDRSCGFRYPHGNVVGTMRVQLHNIAVSMAQEHPMFGQHPCPDSY